MRRPMPSVPTIPVICQPAPAAAQAAAAAVAPRPAKKIFVFCDGTGNQFKEGRDQDGGNSNVVKLYTALRIADGQVAYYHPGVGTMGDPTIRSRIPRYWSQVKGLAFGSGFREQVLGAYQYLMETYADGDEIFIFGFSRGAYAARALAGLLHGYGLLCQGNEAHILYAWKLFQEALDEKQEKMKKVRTDRIDRKSHKIGRSRSFAETFSRRVTVRFMGIWDTVSTVGWIYTPVRLLNMAQNPSILVGRHAVSLDERRAFYRDNLWGPAVRVGDPEWPKELQLQGIRQDIVQVWFPGAHSDVGGSYPQEEAGPANESLAWMIGELSQHGVELCEDRIDMVLGRKRGGIYSAEKIYLPAPRPTHRLHDELNDGWRKYLWRLLQALPQQYYDKDDAMVQWRVPYGTPRRIPNGSLVHGSAYRRLANPVPGEPYAPLNYKLGDLRPLVMRTQWTTADLSDCYVYRRPVGGRQPDGEWKRRGKVIGGWITLLALFVVVALLLPAVVAVAVGCGLCWVVWSVLRQLVGSLR